MKNVIIADVNTICRCDCFENIFDGTEQIVFNFKIDEYTSPQVEIEVTSAGGTVTTYTADLTVENCVACYVLPSEYYMYGQTLKVRYKDGANVRTWFNINASATANGLSENYTLYLVKQSEFQYFLGLRSTGKYSDLPTVIEDDPETKEAIKTVAPKTVLVAGQNITITSEFDEETNTTTYTISATGGGGGSGDGLTFNQNERFQASPQESYAFEIVNNTP